ncbi:hypothetical protein H632_c4580p0, partial [Helicosporidium sp. ATCC 50920]
NWSEDAARILEGLGVQATVVDARFCKPLDAALVRQLAAEFPALISVEEGSVGGFGSHVAQFLTSEGALDSGKLKFRSMVLPDCYIDHGTQAQQLEAAGLTAAAIVKLALKLLGRPIPKEF